MAGAGLPDARGEVFETSSLHGTHGGLVVSTAPVPVPLAAGGRFDLSTRATFTLGQAIEATWPDSGRVYDIAGDSGSLPTQPCSSQANSVCSGAPRRSGSKACYAPPRRGPGRCCFSRSWCGRGHATVNLFQQNPAFFDYRYELEPVPEPTRFC